MKAFVHGISLKKGQFTRQNTGEVIDFDNVIFHVTVSSPDPNTVGDEVLQVKMKRSIVDFTNEQLKGLIGTNVIFDVMPKRNGMGVDYTGITLID